MLEDAGIDLIFTCPGTTEVPLLDASVKRESGPKIMLTTHEGVAVSAADGYSRATGKIGVALLHANVGLANGLAMVEAAKQGRSRVLILNGTKPIANRNKRGFTQTADSVAIARPFTVQSTCISNSDSFYWDALNALNRLHQLDRGPVYLELPQDILADSTYLESNVGQLQVAHTRPSKSSMSRVPEMLQNAKQIAVVTGSDLSETESQLAVRLAETLNSPIFEAPWRELERDTVSTKHPAYAGVLSFGAQHITGTTMIVIGTPAFQEPDESPNILEQANGVIHVVNSFTDTIPGALILAGDFEESLSELQTVAETCQVKSPEAYLSQTRQDYQSLISEALPEETSAPLTVLDVANFLGGYRLTGPIVLDAVTASAAVLKLTPRGPEQRFFATGSGALGWGTGAAVGVAMSGHHDRIFAIVSDGVLQFGIQALHTAVAEQLPITFIVINNRAYHAVSLALQKFSGEASQRDLYPCTQLGDTKLSVIASGYGLASERVTNIGELDIALNDTLHHSGPTMVEVVMSTDKAGNTAR